LPAKPRVLGAPAKTFRDQAVVDTRALDPTSLLLVQLRCESGKAPTAKRQLEILRLSQGGCDEGNRLGRRPRRPTRTRVIMSSINPIRMEALDPAVSHDARDVAVFGHVAAVIAIRRRHDDLGTCCQRVSAVREWASFSNDPRSPTVSSRSWTWVRIVHLSEMVPIRHHLSECAS
jgi:hypothetical protein